MKSRDFCFWLQGFFEIQGNGERRQHGLTEEQVQVIKKHLALVFKHEIDPEMGDAKHQETLNKIHNDPIMRC